MNPTVSTVSTVVTLTHLLCPVCKKHLAQWKQLRLETLDEHVCNVEPSMKWALHCSDENCSTCLNGIFWNEDGELYTISYVSREVKDSMLFIDKNDAPFGSFQRKCNVEIYKKDENKLLVTLPERFPSVLSGMKIWTKWCYKSNENGDILRKRLHFEYITKEGFYHNWGLNMLMYSIRKDVWAWWALRKDPNGYFWRNQLRGTIQQERWADKEWWRVCSIRLAKFLLKHSPQPTKIDIHRSENWSLEQ